MLIAEEKRKNNIAEYLIYMFHIEDIIRSLNFDIELIEKHVINTFNLSYGEKRDMREWYLSLIHLLKKNKLDKSGHYPFLQNLINELNDLHIDLLSNPEEKQYAELYSRAREGIMELREKSGNNDKHEIEICLEGLYGLMLLRLAKKKINPETETAFGLISKMLAYLSAKYNLIRTGNLNPN